MIDCASGYIQRKMIITVKVLVIAHQSKTLISKAFDIRTLYLKFISSAQSGIRNPLFGLMVVNQKLWNSTMRVFGPRGRCCR
jgi:hypothetical protein